MRSAAEIIIQYCDVYGIYGDSAKGESVDTDFENVEKAINEARKEAIEECARKALLNVYILNLNTGDVKEFNNHLPLSYTKKGINETITVDKESILALIQELK